MPLIPGKVTSASTVPLDEHGQPTGPPVPLAGLIRLSQTFNSQFAVFEENVIRPLSRAFAQITVTFQFVGDVMARLFGTSLRELYRLRAIRHYGIPESDIRRVDDDGTVHLWNWRKIDCSQGPGWDEL